MFALNFWLQIGHTGAFISFSCTSRACERKDGPETKKNIKLKTDFRINYPDFYKILLTKRVSDLLELDKDFPYVEIEEIKKNKSFIII